MLKIKNTVNHCTVCEACELVEKHYKDHEFVSRLFGIKKFSHTNDQGMDVSTKLITASLEIKIVPYKTWSPWSSVIGHAKGNTIYINIRKLDLPLRDRVQNICHELCHLLGYKHDGNYNNEYNRGTVPYVVAEIFADYVMSLNNEN